MSGKQKFLYVFLIIITLGFILLYWRKYKQSNKKDYLTVDKRIPFNFEHFISFLGGYENIIETSSDSHSTSQKVLRIKYKDKTKLNIEELKKLNGISGIALNSYGISLVVGNNAKYIAEKIDKEIKNDK